MNMVYHSIYLDLLKLIHFYFVFYGSYTYTYFIKFIPKYFMFLNATVNEITYFFKVGSLPSMEPNMGAWTQNPEIKAWALIKSRTLNWVTHPSAPWNYILNFNFPMLIAGLQKTTDFCILTLPLIIMHYYYVGNYQFW